MQIPYSPIINSGMFLTKGIVKSLKDDKQKNRIIVTLIAYNIEVVAEVLMFSAQKEYGALFFPDVDEEVIVAFLDGTLEKAVILGSVYNETNKPKLMKNGSASDFSLEEKNEAVQILTKAGTTLSLDNAKDKQNISVTTKKGHKIILEDEKETLTISNKDDKTSLIMKLKDGEISVTAAKKIAMTAGQDSLILEDGKGLALKSNGGELNIDVKEIKLQAKSNISAKANSKFSAEGTSSVELKGTNIKAKADLNATVEANTKITVKGTFAEIKGNAVTQVKGNPLLLN